ncbi:glycosyltransferase, partial [Proteus mirabilis]|uniref:glycosyltransferase n=1 Tax=Proteus mirabilis TaxID=584 RepID=UPI003CC7B09B
LGGSPEVGGQEQSAGLLGTPGAGPAMVQAINHRRALPDRGKAMGENARQSIASHYTWQHSAQRLLQALKTE